MPTLPSFSVVGTDGIVLPTLGNGSFISIEGVVVPTNKKGLPVDSSSGNVLPTDSTQRFVYRRPSPYCRVSSSLELIIVLDTSSSVKVLDYRIMKEIVKSFLLEHFDLNENRVRIGLIKYGESVEVPMSLGDYGSTEQLVTIISETRRMKGKPHLGAALREVANEFSISGSEGMNKAVLIMKNGKSLDEVTEPAEVLKEMNVEIFVVDGGDDQSRSENNGITSSSNIIQIEKWRGTDSERLGPIADILCQKFPNTLTTQMTWAPKKTTHSTNSPRDCAKIDYEADVIIMLDSSENFKTDEFEAMKESVAALVDESFDLAPDVVRIGFVIYSDKVAVPVALGHYDDRIELIEKISSSEKINDGVAIALYGMNAARQQFQLHGRENATRIVIMITNGKNRGNAAGAAGDLREQFGVELFVLAIGSDADQIKTLRRIAGSGLEERVIEVESASDIENKAQSIGRHLCGYTTPSFLSSTYSRTTKRDIIDKLTTPSLIRTTRALRSQALCKDGVRHPFQFNFIIDVTSRSENQNFRLVLDQIVQFFYSRFEINDEFVSINLLTVNSEKVGEVFHGVRISELENILKDINQESEDMISPKIGKAIDTMVEVSNGNHIPGSVRILLLVSSDGTSSDLAAPAAEIAASEYLMNTISVSIRKPSSELLSKLSGGVATRVIHLDDWSAIDLFPNWLSYVICDYTSSTRTPKLRTTKTTTKRPTTTTKSPTSFEPSNVEATGLGPSKLSVSWTCCTNNKANYTILYTHDKSIPRRNWKRLQATCRDSFGTTIDNLPSDHQYTVCVMTTTRALNDSAILEEENCDAITINKDTTPPPDFEAPTIAPCNCQCNGGDAVLRPACDLLTDPFRPISTLPPATTEECPCKVQPHSGRCPLGYQFKNRQCYDIDECQSNNGGCTHGCVNTPGSYYCACPYGMARDPLNPTACIDPTHSFDRIAQLLGQYMANAKLKLRDFGGAAQLTGEAN
ncbi:unnamed protein product [Auanema sp. JU1783]|nr:unnamed protein product [Auanema sp. JU1783]